WVLWPAWQMAMRDLGYQLTVVSRTSAFETGQDRHRSYILATPNGTPTPDVDFCPPAPCARCGDIDAVQVWRDPARTTGKWGERYDYRCPHCRGLVAPYAPTAAELLDVDHPGRLIGSPSRLASKSTARAARAFAAWGPHGQRTHPRFTPRPGTEQADALVVSYYSDDDEKGWPILAPVRTLTTTDRHALLTWPSPDATLADCHYRMISIAEQRRLQGVPDHYRFAGNQKDHARMIGNGVPIPTVKAVASPAITSIGVDIPTGAAA
ncbi:DNA cytosine methyltransferase, partial [Glutamicibacter sp. V16R2B1]|uniref:DNA cytosine methyltransferase n=1 Tax=Glutamicibacter sp. V16R2B1 TaxID=2036207 RepID=UPI00128524E0